MKLGMRSASHWNFETPKVRKQRETVRQKIAKPKQARTHFQYPMSKPSYSKYCPGRVSSAKSSYCE